MTTEIVQYIYLSLLFDTLHNLNLFINKSSATKKSIPSVYGWATTTMCTNGY